MKVTEYINENLYFFDRNDTDKVNTVLKDFELCNFKHLQVNPDEDDFIPSDEINLPQFKHSNIASFALFYNRDDNATLEHDFRQVRRLLAQYGWCDLGYPDKVVMYKNDVFIRIFIGLNRVVVSLRNHM